MRAVRETIMGARLGEMPSTACAGAAAIVAVVALGMWASIALAGGPRALRDVRGRAPAHEAMAAGRHRRRRSRRRGHAAARRLHAHDKANLRYAGAVGEEVYETGRANGTLPGTMRVHMIFASTFRGRFTIYTRGGRIDGRGTAKPHGGGIYESFAGELIVTGGSGRYRHAHGTAHLYGTFNRDSYALTIKTAGTLHY